MEFHKNKAEATLWTKGLFLGSFQETVEKKKKLQFKTSFFNVKTASLYHRQYHRQTKIKIISADNFLQ